MKLSSRDQQIFTAIMSLYCDGKGCAIASSKIVKQKGMSMCSATVRNAMARLEKLGYLYSPHTSAGRIPTKKGYQYWFDEFFSLKNIAPFWQPTQEALIELSHFISQKYQVCIFAGLGQKISQNVFRVEVLDFDKTHWLVLLIDRQGQSQNIKITKPLEANEDIRNQFNAWLNMVFGQQTLAEGLKRMQAMANTAPMFCHGSLTQWTRALAEKLGDENCIVVGDSYLFNHIKLSEQPLIGAPLLNYVEDKLALKKGISVIYGNDLPYEGFENLILLSLPYFSEQYYQSRFTILCESSAKIEAIINEFATFDM
ncbi:HrcA family transcriptional regulator [Pseudoalteromonas denitrificans]|uniref:Heat-inducible transcription repressor HrcA n=1 Tax=Pseudoalteromonas denitrificans DSM 6059 TaxID=1123010 RepID=A0A1I1NEY4_9GAMM|nr:HrcA family transcriptional regulator [Pseudoalteromonas denitrificans]SFC94028.1 heat-inducible transcription repressor HrcA [Pseudoalteromonas denitrificans DSM 6059]